MDVAKIYQDVAYVAMVVYVCCKVLFSMFHLTITAHVCCKCVYLDVAYASHVCCNCFIWMLRMVCNGFQVFLCVFAWVSDACFKCFICLQTYVTSVASRCFKSRLGVEHVAM
jgi:hypothetical protein